MSFLSVFSFGVEQKYTKLVKELHVWKLRKKWLNKRKNKIQRERIRMEAHTLSGRRRGATRGSTTPSPRPRNYKLLRNLPLVFPVVPQDAPETKQPGKRVVRRVPDHRRRVRPLAPGRRRLVF